MKRTLIAGAVIAIAALAVPAVNAAENPYTFKNLPKGLQGKLGGQMGAVGFQ